MCMFLARDNEFFDAIDVGNMVKCRVQAGQFNGRKQLYCTQVQAVDNMGAWNNNRFMGGGRQWKDQNRKDDFGQFKIKKTRNDWRQYMEKVARRVPTKQQYAKPPRAPKNNNNSRKKKKNKHAQLAQKQNNQNKSREAKKTEVNVNVNDGAEIATDVAMQEEGVEGAGGGGGGN
eukprot:974476_1